MRELFRMKIAAKRQMTAPQRLLDALSLSEGDEIQIEVADGKIVATHACKAVPTTLLSNELLSKIRKREAELVEGKGLTAEQAMPKEREAGALEREVQEILEDARDAANATGVATWRAARQRKTVGARIQRE